MNSNPTPVKIEPLSSWQLFIRWSDGSQYSLPYAELRFHCPCASCVDEHTGKRIIERSAIASDVRPLGVQPVGRYAIQFSWSDNHTTGLYHYDRLLELCQSAGKALPEKEPGKPQ
jgi:DUF971 family protein